MIRRDRLENALTAVLVICAVAVTIRYYTAPAAPGFQKLERRRIAAWDSLLMAGRARGPASAKVTIVEFGDFQCPVCRTAFPVVKAMLDRYPNDVRLIYYHYPLSYHRYAMPAARAAECAGSQGQFWQMHDALFRNQDSLGRIPLKALGDSAKVPDRRGYLRCVQDTTTPPAIEIGRRLARTVKLTGTPFFVVNGMYLPSFDTAYVIAALTGKKQSL